MALVCDQCQYENKDDALLCNLCGKIFRKEKSKTSPKANRPIDRAESRTWNDKSVSLLSSGRVDEALEAVEKSLEQNPFNARAWANKGSILSRKGDLTGALSCYDRALSYEPHLLDVWHGKAVVEFDIQDFPSSLRSFRELQSLSPGGEVEAIVARLESRQVEASERGALGWLAEGVVRGGQGQFPRALACMEKALELDPALTLAWHLKAGALEKLGRNDEAIASQEKALELEPGNPTHWHWKGVHLKKLRKFHEAIEAYDRAIELEPNQPGYWSDRGLALGCLGPSVEAIECYEKALALAPEAPAPWFNKALEEDRLGRVESALESFRRFLDYATPAMVPQIEQAKLRLAALEPQSPVEAQSSPHSAIVVGAATGKKDSSPQLDALETARLLFDEQRFEDAVGHLDDALQLDPENAALWTLRGDCLRALGFEEDSKACYERAGA